MDSNFKNHHYFFFGFYSFCYFGIRILFFFYQIFLVLFSFFTDLIDKHSFHKNCKIVIIGGGFAGAYAAKKLHKKFQVTLIDTKDYFEFTPSVLRTIVEPNHLKKIQIPHHNYLDLKNVTVYKGTVTQIQKDKVILDTGEHFDFNYLLLTAGSTYNLPFKQANVIMSTRGDTLSRCYHNLLSAKKVLIIGGGIVGVELAGEICEKFPEKEITIVHSGKHLMSSNQIPQGAVEYATKFFQKKNVKLRLAERVIKQISNSSFLTDKGNVLESDLTFLSTGIKSNAFILKNGPYESSIDQNGFASVNEFLQLKANKHIFVAGDIASLKEEKLAQNAEKSAKIAVKNLCIHASQSKNLIKYDITTRPKLISLGKYAGIFVYKSIYFGGILPALMKEFVEFKVMTAYRYRTSKIW